MPLIRVLVTEEDILRKVKTDARDQVSHSLMPRKESR